MFIFHHVGTLLVAEDEDLLKEIASRGNAAFRTSRNGRALSLVVSMAGHSYRDTAVNDSDYVHVFESSKYPPPLDPVPFVGERNSRSLQSFDSIRRNKPFERKYPKI